MSGRSRKRAGSSPPMSSRPNQEGAMQRAKKSQRQRILDAADAQFRRGGLDAISIRRVAADVGLSPMAIYRHYESKDALVEALVQTGLRRFESFLGRAEGGRSPVERVRALAQAYLEFAFAHPHVFDLLFLTRRPSDEPFMHEYKARTSPSFDILYRAVQDGIASKAFVERDPLDVALSVWAYGHGLIALFVAGRFGRGEELFRRFYKRSTDLLIDGLARSA
jgi:AcrR family transcriptional regulator